MRQAKLFGKQRQLFGMIGWRLQCQRLFMIAPVARSAARQLLRAPRARGR